MACSSNCNTGPHETFGACLRAKNLKTQVAIPGTGYDPTRGKAWDKRINAYKNARSEGIQPASSKSADIKAAVQVSDQTGTAFRASEQ